MTTTERRPPVWPIVAVLVILIAGAGAIIGWPTFAGQADDEDESNKTLDAPKKAVAAKTGPVKANRADRDPYEVPDGTPKELMAFVAKLLKNRPPKKDIPKAIEAIQTATGKVLAGKADDETRLEAVRTKFLMFSVMQQNGEQDVTAQILRFAKSIQRDPNAEIRELAAASALTARAQGMNRLDNKQREKLVDEVVAFVKAGMLEDRLGVAVQTARISEQYERADTAARMYREIVALLKTSKNKELLELVPQFEGFGRRQELLGKSLDIRGTTVDGEPFQWSDYKGKVVLVDFWATWCKPCVDELPNVRRNYELYHDKGFEVVGISLDQSHERLKAFLKSRKIPWTNLVARTGEDHPMAVYYGVQGIPTVFLVDRKGNVVDTNARGERLGRLLRGLLGSADGKAAGAGDGKKPAK